MSNLLDQAIVDAEALKEAAIKNAEAAIIEKYSNDIKNVVDQLLEQQEPPPPAPPGAAPPADPAAMMAMAGGEAEPGPIPGPESHVPGAQEFAQNGPIVVDLGQIAEQMNMGDLDAKEYEKSELVAEELGGTGDESNPDTDEETFVIQESVLNNILSEDESLDEFHIGPASKVVAQNTDLGGADLVGEDLDEDVYEEGSEDVVVGDGEMSEGVDLNQVAAYINSLQTQYKTLYENYVHLHGAHQTQANASAQTVEPMRRLIAEAGVVKKQNEKFRSLLQQTQVKLNEVNLHNAKLLYTNRVLNSVSLNERQKDKIVEAVEKAGTVEEAKTIYETLQSAVGTSTISRLSKPKSLNEVVSKSSSAFLPRKRESSAPETPWVDRMQKLAGIK